MARRTTTYAIRLAVEGGGQVKAELVSVGQSGEQSLKRIETAGDRASGGLKGLGRQAELLRTGIRTLGGALIGVTTVGGLAALVERSISISPSSATRSTAWPVRCRESTVRLAPCATGSAWRSSRPWRPGGNFGLPRLVFSPEAPIHRRIEALEQLNRDTRLLVLDQTWWRANPLEMLRPEMDALFVTSGTGNSGRPMPARRPVVIVKAG